MALVRNTSRHRLALTVGYLDPEEERSIDVTLPVEQGLLAAGLIVVTNPSTPPVYITPPATGNNRSAWQASTAYKKNDIVSQAGALYEAKADFTSGATFNAANWTLLSSGSSGAWPSIVNSSGLDRWRTARAAAGSTEAPIFYVGDSHTFGQFWDGATLQGADSACYAVSPAARLRAAFAGTYGDPGEGFWFPNDGRITTGGGISTGVPTGPAVQRNNARFSANTHTLSITIPTGQNITRLRFISGNRAGETGVVTATKNGGAAASITSASNDTPSYTEYACTGGDVFVFTGPSSSALTCLGFALRTAQTNGVPVHRIGRQGYTVPNVIGGVQNGQLGTAPDGTALTSAQIAAEIRACYQWAGASAPLVILQYGTNENTKQLLSTGNDCGVTPGLYRTALDMIVKQVGADGGCVLLVSPCPAPTENTANGAAPLSTYAAMAYSLAAGSRYCAMIDVASSPTWGGGFTGLNGSVPIEATDAAKAAAVAAAGASLRDPNSSHPTAAGYQSYADLVYAAVTS